MTARLQLELPRRRLGGFALLAVLAAALTGCGGGGGDGQSPASPVAPPPPPPPVFSLAVDTSPEPAVGILGHPSDFVARASLTFRFTVDRTGQGDRDWRIPDVSLCEALVVGEDPQCVTVTATPPSGAVGENAPVTVALEMVCDRALTWRAPVEILLGEDDARATATWDVECEIPAFDGELIGVEIYQGPFIRAWSHETGEWTWRTPPRIPWYWPNGRTARGIPLFDKLALTAPMVEVAGRTTLVVARVEHGYPDSYGGLSLSVEGADGSTAVETIARASDRAVVLAPGEAPPEHVDVRPPGIPDRLPDNPRYESEFRLEVAGSEPAEELTGQPFRKGAWRPGSTLVLTLDPAGVSERVTFPIDAEHEIEPSVSGEWPWEDITAFPPWPDGVRFPKLRSPFELDAPERLVIVPIEASWEGDVWLPAPDMTAPSAIQHAISYLLALLPFGDHQVVVVSEALHVEVDPDPHTAIQASLPVFNALDHFKTVHFDPHDFVMGLDIGAPWLNAGWLGTVSTTDVPPRRVWPAAINPVATAVTQDPSVVAHEVGHNLSLEHPPACADNTITPHWPDGIAYWDDAPGPVRQWWMGDWVGAGDGSFNTPRTSEADSRLETGVDVMGYCRGAKDAISDWHFQTANLFRMAAEGWLDLPAEAAALRVGGAQSFGPSAQSTGTEAVLVVDGPSVVVTGSVDETGGWSVSFAELSERAPTRSAGSHRLAVFGPDGSQTGEAFFDPAPLSHGGALVWSLRVGFSGEPPVRLTVTSPDGTTALDWAVSL